MIKLFVAYVRGIYAVILGDYYYSPVCTQYVVDAWCDVRRDDAQEPTKQPTTATKK